MQRKDAPFMWPDFRSGVPQWKLIDYRTYATEGFAQNELIYASIMYKARAGRLAPLRAYSGTFEDREVLDASHDLQQLCARPNPHQSWEEFQDQYTVYVNIAGNNFTVMDRPNKTAQPEALYNLRPDRVFIVPGVVDGRHTVLGYLYVPEGKSAYARLTRGERIEAVTKGDVVPILPEDMMHVKFPNPLDPLEGMGEGLSPISCIAWTTDVDNAVTQFLKLFFEKGIVIPGMVTTDKVNLSENVIARLKQRWKETYGGFENWAEEIFVADHGLKYQRIGLTFDEMGFEEIDERSESRILGPFGVPPILIGTRVGLRRSTYSNYGEARKAFWQDTMVPEARLFETEFQYYLQGARGEFVAFDYTNVPALQEVWLAERESWRADFQAGAVTLNEFRAFLRLEPVPTGEAFFRPLNIMPNPVVATETVPEPEPDMEELPEATEDERKQLKAGISREAKLRLWKQVDDIATSWEGRYSERARDAFERDRRALLVRLNEGKAKALQGKQSVDFFAVERDWKEYFATEAPENWREEFLPVIQGTIIDQGQAWNSAFGIQFDVRNLFAEAQAGDFFSEFMDGFAQDIIATTQADMEVLIRQSLANGWTVDELRKQLGLTFDRYVDPAFTLDGRRLTDDERAWFQERSPRYRRENIARTETIRSSNAGSLALFDAWEVVEMKEWLATGDDRTREDHLVAWSQYSEGGDPGPIPLKDAFTVGGESLMYPGDPRGSPAQVCQCRCTLLPYFSEAAGTQEEIRQQREQIEALMEATE
jgi:HK97 family phage portal protein